MPNHILHVVQQSGALKSLSFARKICLGAYCLYTYTNTYTFIAGIYILHTPVLWKFGLKINYV